MWVYTHMYICTRGICTLTLPRIYICEYIRVCACAHVKNAHKHTHVFTYGGIHTHVCMPTWNMHIYTPTYLHMRVYTYVYVCTRRIRNEHPHIHIGGYTHTYMYAHVEWARICTFTYLQMWIYTHAGDLPQGQKGIHIHIHIFTHVDIHACR